MAITKDGASSAFQTTAASSFTNTFVYGGSPQTDALLLLQLVTTSPTSGTIDVSTVTDDDGNTWELLYKRYESGWDTGVLAGGPVASGMEIWFTKAPTVDTDLDITVTWSGTFDSMCAVLSPKFLGTEPTQPFDQNPNAMIEVYLPAPGRHDPSAHGVSSSTAHIVGLYFWSLVGFSTAPHFPGTITFDGVSEASEAGESSFGTNHTRSQVSIGTPVASAYGGVDFVSGTIEENQMAVTVILTADAQLPPSDPSRSWSIVIS